MAPYPVRLEYLLRSSVSIISAVLCAIPLAACLQTTGDFGRPRPGILENSVYPFTGTVSARLRGEAASFYALTEDEKELRNRAWRFLMPEADAPWGAFKHDQFAFHKILPPRESDITLFHRTIMGGPHLGELVGDSPRVRAAIGPGRFRSLTSRYNRVRDTIIQDHALLPHFKLIATQVVEADRVRARALTHVAHVTAEQAEEARQRICENANIIARVNWAFVDRAAQYRYSLEHLLVEGPEREAIPSERTLMAFEADIAGFRKGSPAPEACVEVVELPPPLEARPLVRKY